MTVNQLENLLNDIARFNNEAEDLRKTARALIEGRETIIASAKALGINKANAGEMLLKIKCEVLGPPFPEIATGAAEQDKAA